MKSLVLVSKGKLEVREVPVPLIGRGEMLVEMKCCGVCGTDLEKVYGDAITPPVLGHEAVGIVADVGKGVEGFSVGDRVFPHHHAPCYRCADCSRGDLTMCREFPRHNIRPGGFAEYFAVPAWNVEKGAVLRLPRSLSFEEASFIEPLGCCIRGLDKLGKVDGAPVLILGAGAVGLSFLILLRERGAGRIVVADLSDFRRKYALDLGAAAVFDPRSEGEKGRALRSLPEGHPRVVIIATGSPAAFSSALRDVSRGGRVLLFGLPQAGTTVPFDFPGYFLSEATIVSSYSTSEVETRKALRLLATGRVSLGKLASHRFALEETPEAFRVSQEQTCEKALVCR
jgi:L-iditol 2-dehydrogenase